MRQRRSVIALLLVILLCTVWTGCSTAVKERQGESARGGGAEGISKYRAKYYNFDDVLVPGELNYKQDRSFIYETPQFKAGEMVFTRWWLDVESLIDFFTYHMEKDNWKLLNSYRGRESSLNFSKPDKTCVIRIMEKWYGTTEVEVRVGPLGVNKM